MARDGNASANGDGNVRVRENGLHDLSRRFGQVSEAFRFDLRKTILLSEEGAIEREELSLPRQQSCGADCWFA
jgi:hypothetical protein